MSEYRGIHWHGAEARIKGFSTAGRGGKSIVKIEIEVLKPSRLGMLLADIQEASEPYKPAPPEPKTPDPVLALPAPRLRLSDGRDG